MAEQITVSVSSEAANIYRSASKAERRKLDLLVSLSLCEGITYGKSLTEIMEEISRNAQQRGLTPEILSEVLEAIKREG